VLSEGALAPVAELLRELGVQREGLLERRRRTLELMRRGVGPARRRAGPSTRPISGASWRKRRPCWERSRGMGRSISRRSCSSTWSYPPSSCPSRPMWPTPCWT